MKSITLYWFKKDLRILDNLALTEACQNTNAAAIYIHDPKIIESQDFSSFHLDFIRDSLISLEKYFNSKNSYLNIFYDNPISVFNKINQTYTIKKLIMHHETGNFLTNLKNNLVSDFCNQNSIELIEYQSNGVVRDLKNRDGWSKLWNSVMYKPVLKKPDISKLMKISNLSVNDSILKIGHNFKGYKKTFYGGEQRALNTLDSFLSNRGNFYSKEMSSPVTAPNSCSRLSSYITYGNISIRQIFHETKIRKKYLRENKVRTGWLKSLSSFSSRLRWHCHFIQKLEMQPNLEFTNMVRAYDTIRKNKNEHFFLSWKDGMTGFPMVDACMRFLKLHGWINFRMRAMLVSFASYNLWIDWRITSKYLSKYFIDYEPGIHYNQFQMQSGVTGMNSVRIYNPVKQHLDHDPNSDFIRKWVPELRNIPDEYMQTPHLLSQTMQKKVGCFIGKDYPAPVVDLKLSTLRAKKEIYDIRSTKKAKDESKTAYLMHGSRRNNRNIQIFN